MVRALEGHLRAGGLSVQVRAAWLLARSVADVMKTVCDAPGRYYKAEHPLLLLLLSAFCGTSHIQAHVHVPHTLVAAHSACTGPLASTLPSTFMLAPTFAPLCGPISLCTRTWKLLGRPSRQATQPHIPDRRLGTGGREA